MAPAAFAAMTSGNTAFADEIRPSNPLACLNYHGSPSHALAECAGQPTILARRNRPWFTKADGTAIAAVI
jgi:hypothetical protein